MFLTEELSFTNIQAIFTILKLLEKEISIFIRVKSQFLVPENQNNYSNVPTTCDTLNVNLKKCL